MYKAILLLFLPLLLGAQTDDVPLVMFASGPVTYANQESPEARTLYTGNYLTGGGNLTLGEAAELELVRGDQYVKLDLPGRYSLSKLFTTEKKSTGFFDRFIHFVKRGLEESATAADLEKAYLNNQGNAQGNVEGYGDAGLSGLMPFGGTLGPGVTPFNWPADGDNAGGYRLRLVDSLTEAVVLAATVRDTTVVLDLVALSLLDGHRYYWEVFPNRPAADGPARLGLRSPAVVGTRIYFTYADRPLPEVLQSLTAESTYQVATTARRHLLEAMVLEGQDYLYAADEAYRRGLVENDPLVRRAYAAFLGRWNQRPAARQLLKAPRR